MQKTSRQFFVVGIVALSLAAGVAVAKKEDAKKKVEVRMGDVLDVGKTPPVSSMPSHPKYTAPMKRKLKGGGFEICRFARYGRANDKSTDFHSDCYPLYGRAQGAIECPPGLEGWLAPELGCQPKKEVLNKDSPFEACKYVRLSEESRSATEEIEAAANLAAACELVMRPESPFDVITQAIRREPWYKSNWLWRKTPAIPKSSQTAEVKTLLDFGIKAAEETLDLMQVALRNDAENHICFKMRSRTLESMSDAGAFKDLQNSKDKAAAEMEIEKRLLAKMLESSESKRCAEVVATEMNKYHTGLPQLRAQMLLAEQEGENIFWETDRPIYLVNHKFKAPKDVIVPENPSIRESSDLEYSKATDPEIDTALSVIKGWVEEIEREFNAKYAKEMQAPGVKHAQSRRPGARDKFQRSAGSESGKLQDKWESFYAAKMKEKRAEAAKAAKLATVQHPVFQALANSKPGPSAWEAAYAQLYKRNLTAQDRVFERLEEGKALREKYEAEVAAYQAGKGEKPSEPSISAIRRLINAKGTLEAMVEDDPRLCAAATMYWDTVKRFDSNDTVVDITALVGATIVAGMVSGPFGVSGILASGATGIAGGAYIGWKDYKESDARAEISYGLTAVCVEHKQACRSPGDLEQYFESKQESVIAKYTMFMPFKGDLAVMKGVAIGLAATATSQALKPKRLVSWIKDKRIDYEAALRGVKKDGLAQLAKDEAAIEEALKLTYKRIFDTERPTPKQQYWAGKILSALYKEKNGILVAVDPEKHGAAFQRDFEMVAKIIREVSERDGVSFANGEKIHDLLRLLQDPATGIVPKDANEAADILRTALTALSDGRTPAQALATIKNFVQMGREAPPESTIFGKLDKRLTELGAVKDDDALTALKRIEASEKDEEVQALLKEELEAVAKGDKTPAQALVSFRQNVKDIAEEESQAAHLVGLSHIYDKQMEIIQKDFEKFHKQSWHKAKPSKRQEWMEYVERNPKVREEARIKALEEALTAARIRELQDKGLDARKLRETIDSEKGAIRKKAEEMNACAAPAARPV